MPRPAPPDSGAATILVVDDSHPGRYVTCRTLKRAGYRVIEAANGLDALAQAQTLPDLVVLDVKLPDISGFEVCKRLRADPDTAHLPVLHLSSTFLDEASVIEGLEGGADGYLTLPVEPPVLLAYARTLLRSGRMVRGLQESEQRFRALFESMSDGLLLADPSERRFVMANQAICDMLGYTKEELQQRWIPDIHPAETLEGLRGLFDRVLAGTMRLVPDLPTLRKDGTVIRVDITNTLLEIDGHTVVLGSFRDVTERRAVQARLAQSDRLASVGMLAAGVAHELNNPLAYVLYNLQAMQEDIEALASAEPETVSARLRELDAKTRSSVEGAERMRDIVQDLQSFSRSDGDKESALALRPVIEAVAAMAANEIRFRARLELAFESKHRVLGTEGRLAQAFLNLLLNAAQSIEEGRPEANTIRVSTRDAGDEVRVAVRDTGPGIPAENLDRLFDPFFTTKAPGEGTGLGLAICHRIVEEHGGHIEVQSKLGEGSVFELVLPAYVAPQAEPTPPETLDPASPDTPRDLPARLLLVDDEPHLLRALRRLLARTGYEVVATTSGLEAQRLIEQGEAFDVMLCDLMMPDILGMDLHAWLVEHHPRLAQRVVFLTGGTFTPRAQDYLASVDNTVLPKPVSIETLLAAVRAQLDQPT